MTDDPASTETLLDSRDIGWRAARVQRLQLPARIERVQLAPIDDQLIDLQLHGDRLVHSRDGRTRKQARLVAGMLAMTAPDRPSDLHWTSSDPAAPVTQIRLLVPGATLTRVAEEVWEAEATRHPAPDGLAFDDEVLRVVLSRLHRAALDGLPEAYVEAAVEFLAVHLLTVHGSAPEVPHLRRDDARIARVLDLLHSHLDETFDLARLSEVAGLSRFHLLRLFREHVGDTPARYHRRLRLEHAARLLRTTETPIVEVALRCGFTDQTHFTRAFRVFCGTTPSAYRSARTRGSNFRQEVSNPRRERDDAAG